ncbi:antirepressor AbbA [Anoxybacteroides tepidamans]|uniref:antirepressor AbbA n=1 Tax=Anoxybacteroides tepidamans TaxID=265948 RepID=UPI000485C690|nr:antirepressor AbbA [Anoxybacillus tepidamans]
MQNQWLERLSLDEQTLLLDVLFTQQYALELISCEIADMESGYKQVDEARYRSLMKLYRRIVEELSL